MFDKQDTPPLTGIQKAMFKMGRNVPLNRKQVAALPKGFHPTSVFETPFQKSERLRRVKHLQGRAKLTQHIPIWNENDTLKGFKTIYHY